MGIASRVLAVGRLAAFAEAGVGAVVTQSVLLMAHGPRVLDGVRDGRAPRAAITASLADDDAAALRQVAAVDNRGRAWAFTGPGCMSHAGHATGDGWSAQSNLAADASVWPAMGAAYEALHGPFEQRLLAALDAADAAGGDLRGRQSAALRIVAPEPTGDLLTDVIVDVRVDDHDEPLGELRRLVDLAVGSYELQVAEQMLAGGDADAAIRRGRAVVDAHPHDASFRCALAFLLVAAGEVAQARDQLARATRDAGDDRWQVMVARAVRAGLVDEDQAAAVLHDRGR